MDIKKVQREAHEAVERVVTIARHAEASFAAQIDALKKENAELRAAVRIKDAHIERTNGSAEAWSLRAREASSLQAKVETRFADAEKEIEQQRRVIAGLESELTEARKLLATYAVTVMGDFGGTPVVEVTRSPTCSKCEAPTGACVCPRDPMGEFMAATVEAVAAIKPAEEQGPWVIFDKGDILPWGGTRGWSRYLDGVNPYGCREDAEHAALGNDNERVVTLAEAHEIEKARR